jgi:Holliday junction resolvasome RuvABC endonuclease subunit
MSRREHDELVLSIYPTHRGLTYTLFEAPLTPIDWGLKRVTDKDKNARSLEIVVQLCKSLRPDTLVIEQSAPENSKRSERIRRLHALIAGFAEAEHLTLARYSRAAVKATFREAGAITRYEIAQAIASYLPAFEHRMPRVKKLWQSEDLRFSLFDAAALALTHFAVVPEDAEPP